jgi:hypothetical protein
MASWKTLLVLFGGGFLCLAFASVLAWFNGLLFSGVLNAYEIQARQFANNEVLGVGAFGFLLIVIGIVYAYVSRNSP